MTTNQFEGPGSWLFRNHPEVSSVFSDLEVAAGIPYTAAREKITEADFPELNSLYEEYQAIDFEDDSKNDGPKQKAVLQKMTDLLNTISLRS